MSKSWTLGLLLVAVLAALCGQAWAQSLISGDIAGIISDPSGAVIPGAAVELRSLDTGAVQTSTANQNGAYRFSLLKPGRYEVVVSATGFQKGERAVTVAVGQITTTDISLQLGSSSQTVEVSAVAPLINPESSINTAFTQVEVQSLPSAGGDLTNIAQTVAGVVVNVTGGYGNFTINGLPATSNLFTVNGENDMDPYFNINNSGASNLALGQNEVQEATVIANPYAGEFGQLAGAQVTYVTKSGSNAFHGGASYWWNGRLMNANDWFLNQSGVDRPFDNANQWAADVGGPIRKNSTFFYVDNEGMRFVLPNVFNETIPTPAFANAVLNNVQTVQPNEFSTYQKMMNLWLNAPGAANAQPLDVSATKCQNITLPGFNGATQPCAATFRSTANALGSEWILAGRVDQRIGTKDNAYFRYKGDHGLQPTHVDPISSSFDALSNQPSYDMQFNETHIFGPTSTNSFTSTFSHYVAQFAQDHAAATSTFPYSVISSNPVPFSQINYLYEFPQGRNITQYQFIDDFTHIYGNHSLKFGANFRRYDVSDHNFYWNDPAVYFGYVSSGMQKFVSGMGYQYRMSLNLANDVPIAMWGLGFYAQDQWKVRQNLTLTLALRAERNSNPVCQFNCFANFNGPVNGLASFTSSDPGSVPYASDIAYGQHRAYPGVDAINLSPRFGFSWSPNKDNKTVISGGFGIFYDSPAAGVVDDMLSNPPVSVAIRVRPTTGVLVFDPAGGATTWQQSANAFSMTKSYNQISSELAALGSVFAAPAVTAVEGTYHAPQWQEWNLQVQRQLANSWVLVANYVGNHGIKLPYTNSWWNAFDPYEVYPGVAGIREDAAAVPNYGNVNTLQSGAISNYNGLSLTVRKQLSHGLTALFNYTWSHNLDEASNGGIFTYGDTLTQSQINPLSLREANYGNSDYDIRHSFNAGWVFNPAPRFSNHILQTALSNWSWSGKWFWRSGLPYSITDNNLNGYIFNGGGSILASPIAGGGQSMTCGHGNTADVNGNGTPCLNANAFLNTALVNYMTAWSSQTRNQYRGPHFFDIDMNLYRTFKFGETRNLKIGLQAFNVFNHPNFGLPDAGLGDPTFGLITGTAGTPTSPYGTFLGFDSSPRLVQLSGKFQF
ncbi:MAG TPA: carboxypeptidase regulatory-like domain-containing protein [Bryobacteraceae bacterium]|nr:carboxypeptidase regulatory-like domain-containing protein [Bryobacteraceae bacterium]